MFYQDERSVFYQCEYCSGIFRPNDLWLNKQEEKKRYLLHQCSNVDLGYLNFVSPITNYIESHFDKEQIGLDYGCGHQPILSNHLSNKGYRVKNYDPYFYDRKELLRSSYGFIVCCEVIEHFYSPEKEFQRLFGLLDQGGALVAMTHIFNEEITFSDWYYKNDPTHVFIYTVATLNCISQTYGFKPPKVDNRLIVFEK